MEPLSTHSEGIAIDSAHISQVSESQRGLARANVDFLDFVRTNPQCLNSNNFKLLELSDDLFTLQPWPTFINRQTRASFVESSEELCAIIKSIPKRVFDNDPQKVSDYYGIPRSMTEIYLKASDDDHLAHLMSRGDFILSKDGLQCIEYNVTPNLGGWQTPIWKSLYANHPLISRFWKEYDIKIHEENLLRFFLESMLEAGLGKVRENEDSFNIALVLRGHVLGTADSTGTYLNKMLKELMKKQTHLNGSIILCDYQHMDLKGDDLQFKGKRVHTVVEFYHGVVSPSVLKAFQAGTIRLMNGPICDLLSNKLNMAIISDYDATGVFTPQEKQIIDKYVPWTRKILTGPGSYKNETIADLGAYVRANREGMVIKPSLGYGGKGVCVGKKATQAEWDELVDTALEEKTWLVQETVTSSPGLYQTGEKGSDIHDMVWGFFVFGSRYQGAWVRVMPQKNNKGVVNCHQGATVSVVFEVDE
ncbi:MAG: circularly permuted type 2 ATP-grasp protein [bacterium]|nr:circularly permuted type 2 ATP-grasp protein [bacterium]